MKRKMTKRQPGRFAKGRYNLLPESIREPALLADQGKLSVSLNSADLNPSQLQSNASTTRRFADFIPDEPPQEFSTKLRKKCGNDLVAISLILTLFTLIPVSFTALPPFSSILHIMSLVLVTRLWIARLRPRFGFQLLGTLIGLYNALVLLVTGLSAMALFVLVCATTYWIDGKKS